MATRRKDDAPGARTRFRSERLTEDGGKWYFCTREGTLEGPYSDKYKAVEGLDAYIAIVRMNLSGTDTELGFKQAFPPTLH